VHCDVVIRGGIVYDGTGKVPVRADVGLAAGEICEVGDLSAVTARQQVDAAGLAVAPGFIDVHTHSDLACFLGPQYATVAAGTVRQGVTTEIAGNCGFSPFPCLPERRTALEQHLAVLFGPSDLEWHDLVGYREHVRAAGLLTNLAPIVGHGSVRVGVMGFENRPPSEDEMRTMMRLVDEAMEQGAVGFSSGLIYSPGVYAATDELIRLSGAAARYGRPYITHMRGETYMVADSVREAIRIASEAGVPLHISHHKTAGKENWGRTAETLALIDAARRSGIDVTMDMYPYTAGSTLLYGMLPPWSQEGGIERMLERLQDTAVRDRIVREFATGIPGWENFQQAAGWDGIFISSCPGRPELEGRCIVELADNAGKSPADFVFDLLIEQRARVTMILHVMCEEDVRRVLTHEASMIGSDGIPLPGKPHPRWAGTFSRVIGRYWRDSQLLDLPTWIRKMTSMSAERFGLKGRGVIARGLAADLVVFDPGQIADRATYDEPLLPPTGVHHVYVNGRAVVRDGALTGEKPGRVLGASA
jgi:N-acyl-D-amino-acid deacylase